MSDTFEVQVLTPSQTLFAGKVSEVVLPAHDGEVGVLPGHADFVGLLGTGALKTVVGGNDYWYMLSSGVYQVENGKLTILADLGEAPKTNVDLETLNQELKAIEAQLADFKATTPDEYPALKQESDRVKARIAILRRTELVN